MKFSIKIGNIYLYAIYTDLVQILNIILFIRLPPWTLLSTIRRRTQKLQARTRTCRVNHVLIAGKSLNTSVSSKNEHNESAANRGHVSEVIVCSTADEKSANKSDKVIASLEKHRNTKSNKKSDTNKSLSKNDSAANKSKSKGKAVGRIEAQTCKEGEKWVETSKNVEQIISVDLTSNENQNQPENTNSKAKTRHTSKKKD